MLFRLSDIGTEVYPNIWKEDAWDADEIVRVIHRPTGLMVEQCRMASRALNRHLAQHQLQQMVEQLPDDACPHEEFVPSQTEPQVLICTECKIPVHKIDPDEFR